jgi:hypothetical protein
MRGYQHLKDISDNKKDFIFFLVLLFFGILIFAPSLQIPFISDEVAFIKRNTVSNLAQLLALFDKKDYDGFYYRPLGNLVSGILTLFAGDNAFLYRLFNVILHVVNTFIFYRFAKIISEKLGNSSFAYVAPLIFLVFPGNDYALLWHTALFDRLLLGVYFLGLLSFLKNYRITIASVCFFILAIFSKESAFSFPFVIFIANYFLNEKRGSLLNSLKKSGVYFLFLLAFLLVRMVVFNNNVFTAQDAHSSAGLFTIIKNYFFFGGFLLFPFSPRMIQQLLLSHRELIFILVGFGSIATFVLVYKNKSDKLFWFLLLFVILTILPASRLFMRWYLYLPSTGFVLLLCYLIFTTFKERKQILYASLVIIFSIYSSSLLLKEVTWLNVSKKSVVALKELQKEFDSTEFTSITFLTIPAKVGDVPIYQLQFETLVQYYLKKQVSVTVLSKSFFSTWDETIAVKAENNGTIVLQHNKDNYFLLFDNKKNINFDLKTGKQLSFPIIWETGTLYVFFSEGKFQNINGKL